MKLSFLKRIYQNLTKTLPKSYEKPTEALQKPNQKPIKTLSDPNLEITLANSGKTSDFPLRVFTIVGKQGYGKTTLAKKSANIMNLKEFQ